jgi:anti-anti-sigma factor
MELTVEVDEPARSYRIAGELDLATTPILLDALLFAAADAEGDLRLDVSQLRFVDSSGLHALVRIANRLSTGRLLFAGASDSLRSLLSLTGLDRRPCIGLLDD